MLNPKIFLAIDNCFAAKRWTRPREWAAVIKDFGITHVEASADNECDPLYADPAYLEDWLREIETVVAPMGMRVSSFYSGHGTYATLGLGHTDSRNRDRIQNQWVKVMIRNAARLGACLGFYVHGFNHATLQDPAAFAAAETDLYDRLAHLAIFARDCNLKSFGAEQMYTPYLIPWTLKGSRRFMREIYARASVPVYLTLDTGHQSGQPKFLRPTRRKVKQALRRLRASGRVEPGLWLGPDSAYALLKAAAAASESEETAHLRRLEAEMDRYPHLFSEPEDCDTYRWLEQLACYSPIIHLQQTDGKSSPHRAFTKEENRRGIVRADRILQAIAKAYEQKPEPDLPPPITELYLTIEVFSATADLPSDILGRMAESVAYWREYVPKDGLTLQEIITYNAQRDNVQS
jgi:sugar phosphate isomerase/epimerase